MKELLKTLANEFKDKEYAHAYMEEFSNILIASQIKALREQRDWTQQQLAKASGMKQERISTIEDVNYDAWTLKTLRKLARAFDLTIKVSFEKFSTSMVDIPKINRTDLQRKSRDEDLLEFVNNDCTHYASSWTSTVLTHQNKTHLSFIRSKNEANFEIDQKAA